TNSDSDTADEEGSSSSARYRTQNRGGKGLRDIRTSDRNGNVIGIARVTDQDEIFMMTAKGKIQRIKAADVGVIGRNTQGVRIMSVDDGDSLVAVVRVPPEEASEEEAEMTTAAESSADDPVDQAGESDNSAPPSEQGDAGEEPAGQ
ncbi:MAG: DNA gyrase subunit A, partial [Pirellulales bacterium]|nr:DNA gyrase subunit A [Pirellulales bacterium]